MKKRVYKILLVLAGIVIIVLVHLNSSFFIEKQQWKYWGGAHIGDWLDKSDIEINDRMIYTYQGKARIVFSLGKYLYIKNIETNENGIYINKS